MLLSPQKDGSCGKCAPRCANARHAAQMRAVLWQMHAKLWQMRKVLWQMHANLWQLHAKECVDGSVCLLSKVPYPDGTKGGPQQTKVSTQALASAHPPNPQQARRTPFLMPFIPDPKSQVLHTQHLPSPTHTTPQHKCCRLRLRSQRQT
jgi:hypothetical protein